MQSFSLSPIPEIVFGPGRLSEIGAKVTAYAGIHQPVLLVSDPALLSQGITARAYEALAANGHRTKIYDAFSGEPKASDIDTASAIGHDMRAKCIVGLGGGSALDTAKIVAACTVSGAPAETYALGRTPLPSNPLPVIAVPTTAGTGSEVTSTCIFTNSNKVKVWAWGAELKPRVALLDPELTIGVPPAITAATAIDALVHAIEASTNRNSNDAADVFCHRAISLITSGLFTALADGSDVEARGALLLASCFAGIGIENCGTALAHNISHALAALAPIPHGRATALAMLATMDWAIEGAPARFAKVASAMGEASDALAAVRAFEKLVRGSGVNISLERDGLELNRPDKLAMHMAAPENAPMRVSTLRHVSDDDLLMLAQRVYALR